MPSPSAALEGVYLVIPVHNRLGMTLGCLECLESNGVLGWATAIVVDDGSTDGTGAVVRERFPEIVARDGDGLLWWTGGIVVGMKEAMLRGAKVIVWLNDDCRPRPGTIELLAKHAIQTGEISVGQTISPTGGCYTGSAKTLWALTPVVCPAGELAPCDTFTGNCVAIPRRIVEEVGYPDNGKFPHVFADQDYGFRAQALGFKSVVLGDALCDGIDSLNQRATSWLLDGRPARQLLASLLMRTSSLHPPTFWLYSTRYWPVFGPARFAMSYLKLGLSLVIRSVLPRKLLIRAFGHRSVAWKVQAACDSAPSDEVKK